MRTSLYIGKGGIILADQVTNYQCPACAGALQFDAANGNLMCEYCGSSYSVEEIEALYAEQDKKAEKNMAKAEEERKKEQRQQETEGGSKAESGDGWGEDAAGMRAYTCPSCGAELICDETTAATSCPYCGNPTIVPGQFAGVLRPDFVIPFKLKKADAIAALKKHYKGKILLPTAFKTDNHLQEIQGVYVPFWLFDQTIMGKMIFACTRSTTYTAGDYRIIRTNHYHVLREGKVSFLRIPVDGSQTMPDDYMESIEPYDYGELKEFSTAYLPGYLANKYDVAAKKCSSRAGQRAKVSTEACLRDTVQGYETVQEKSQNIRLKDGMVKYALLPVWLLSTKWSGRNYLFAMNGQTGKMVGDLPVDKKKKWCLFGGVYGVVVLLTALIVLFFGGLGELLGM